MKLFGKNPKNLHDGCFFSNAAVLKHVMLLRNETLDIILRILRIFS